MIEKLGLDIPPTPLVTLEEISSREVQLTWKHAEPASSVTEHHVEVNGRIVGSTRKHEMGASISNLSPGTLYDIRIFCLSAGSFQTPSSPLRIRTHNDSSISSQDESSEPFPTVRAISVRNPTIAMPTSAPMARELSGGHPMGRRGTTNRRPSPASNVADSQHAHEGSSQASESEQDGNLVELSKKLQEKQQETENVESQVLEEEIAHETRLKELTATANDYKQRLKERDEESNDLRKKVNKAETANRTAQNEKMKKERLIAQKDIVRRTQIDEIAKWEDQIVSMKEEMAGIETQKAAIERRTQSELREIRKKAEEEQKEVAMLEEDNKEKALQIKALEEERQQLNVEDETDESREADRLEYERNMRWRLRFDSLQHQYTRIWNDLQLINQQVSYTHEQITQYEARRAHSLAFAPQIPPLDFDTNRRPIRPIRRPRQTGSHGSSISSPRGPFVGVEPFSTGPQFTSAPTSSPTTVGGGYFNPQNGMSWMPTDISPGVPEDLEAISSIPMSPRADSLLPADLLGDESADELPETEGPIPVNSTHDSGTTPFPKVTSPVAQDTTRRVDTPSAGSSSSRSFSSPLQTSVPNPEPQQEQADSDHGSDDHQEDEEDEEDEVVQQPTKPKYSMSSMFGLNRQRGKTLADQPPLLGSLKPGQSQSFPRNVDEFDSTAQPRRRLSYGGNWAFPVLRSGGEDKEQEATRLSATRRAFQFPGFGKSSAAGGFDPFGGRSGSLDPGLRGETSSPRPSSTYSFDKMPRPSMESQFRAWATDKQPIRNSPLVPEWGSLHSFSRSHSRRPSIVYGSTSNLSLPQTEEEVIEDRKPSRPLQAPIGTRPTSSQQNTTPRLNPAAPSFTMFFGKRGEKVKERSKAKDSKERVGELESGSPPDSRKSKDTGSIAATISTMESDTLDRTMSSTSAQLSLESTPIKPTFISKITRKASSNKFGSWKDKGGLFSRKEPTTPNGEQEEESGSTEQLGKSVESIPTTPGADDRKSGRSSLTNWNFMRKTKKGQKEDLTASEISESSERASYTGDEREDEDDDRK